MENRTIFRPFAEGQIPNRFQPGQMVYLQGAEATHFYYVLSGTVKSYISSASGGERTLTIHHGGDLMGEAAFFDEQPRVSSAVALTECAVVSIDRARLSAVFAAHPDLAFSMMQYLARTVRLLSGHVDEMSFLSAERRLARFLLDRSELNGTLHSTHEEIGAAIGASRVTVSRTLNRFAREGLVALGYGQVTLLRPDGLAEIISNGD